MKLRAKTENPSLCNGRDSINSSDSNMRRRSRTTSAGKVSARNRGFTLIEMAVVITMILVLLSIALPMYNNAITHAREAKLRQNLSTLNEVIEKYSLDKGHAPLAPDDLVQAGYIKFIPEDITGNSDSWKWEQEDPEKAWDPNQTGIGSVHSGSDEASSLGTPYSEW
jgi:general secretion pathway protein G